MSAYKITQKGWETYTGDIGQVTFKDGVSVGDYPEVYIDRIALTLSIESVDTGTPAGLASRLIGEKSLTAPAAAKFAAMTPEQIAAANAAAAGVAAKSIVPTKFYDQAGLEAVVDKDGIQGLRAIAAPYGVKAKSINDLMGAIIQAQEVVRSSQGPKTAQLAQSASTGAAAALALAAAASAAADAAVAAAAAEPTHVVEANV